MNWTEERVEQLKRLWAEGFSASQIAAQLGGVTRNAVIGKAHRLKLAGRTKTQKRRQKAAANANAAPEAGAAGKRETRAQFSPPEATGSGTVAGAGSRSRRRPTGGVIIGATALKVEFIEEAAVAPQIRPRAQENVVVPFERRLGLMQLTERTCKWPLGDPLSEDFAFCGADSDESGPYCACHARLAFSSAADKRKN
ncbi:MAG: GcrA cell cycle regulator [Candidatus Tokpelaia sp.]|uniref:GcrA family cell cycle regulator n=1 Tax=Candidatus Tokpelaia sp. TaxID=2233777 RepID=UPI00123C531C|nr:GcrA family cell cycle regulator [Candidatus Tokpelaia sp.]KAA6205637.1 MAG: GcrA cell cycle regulator [Candidatus Tokpelaia sp.]KAA6207252.1 MAG: GcrA cell cycle regulator [Candidatus Tokpelaia sp.]KAA6405224.1 GcrA cell cycle regulator [Candidatus Tokpelaia sp.]